MKSGRGGGDLVSDGLDGSGGVGHGDGGGVFSGSRRGRVGAPGLSSGCSTAGWSSRRCSGFVQQTGK